MKEKKNGILGLKLLRAVLQAKDKKSFREIQEASLVGEAEAQAYAFIKAHVRRYKKLPSVETVIGAGHELAKAFEPVQFYLERLMDRRMLTTINEHQRLLAKCMEARDMKEAVIVLRKQLASVVSLHSTRGDSISLGDAAREVMEDYWEQHRTVGLPGITSGWPSYDEQTGGDMPGDLITIISRMGMGKTWVLLWRAIAAWRAGHAVLLTSGEMMYKAIGRRLLGMMSKVNPKYIKMGKLNPWSTRFLRTTIEDIDTGAPFHLLSGSFDKSTGGLADMIEVLMPEKAAIDAGYLFTASVKAGRRSYSADHEEAKALVREMKGIATGYGIPIDTTMQFNRKADVATSSRASTRLDLKHAGGTDAVGQDSDTVMGLRLPPAPFSKTYRIMEMMKTREDESMDFATNFDIPNMLFDEIPMEEIMGQGARNVGDELSSTDFML